MQILILLTFFLIKGKGKLIKKQERVWCRDRWCDCVAKKQTISIQTILRYKNASPTVICVALVQSVKGLLGVANCQTLVEKYRELFGFHTHQRVRHCLKITHFVILEFFTYSAVTYQSFCVPVSVSKKESHTVLERLWVIKTTVLYRRRSVLYSQSVLINSLFGVGFVGSIWWSRGTVLYLLGLIPAFWSTRDLGWWVGLFRHFFGSSHEGYRLVDLHVDLWFPQETCFGKVDDSGMCLRYCCEYNSAKLGRTTVRVVGVTNAELDLWRGGGFVETPSSLRSLLSLR